MCFVEGWVWVVLPQRKRRKQRPWCQTTSRLRGLVQTSRQFRNCRWSFALSLRRNTRPALLQAASASRHESPRQLTLMLTLSAQHVCSRWVAKPALPAFAADLASLPFIHRIPDPHPKTTIRAGLPRNLIWYCLSPEHRTKSLNSTRPSGFGSCQPHSP